MNRRALIGLVCASLFALAACQTTQPRLYDTPPAIEGPSISIKIHVKRPQFLDDTGWRNVTTQARLPILEDGRFSGSAAFNADAMVKISGARTGRAVVLDLRFVRTNWIDRHFSKSLTLSEGVHESEERTTGFGAGEPTSGPLMFTIRVEIDEEKDG